MLQPMRAIRFCWFIFLCFVTCLATAQTDGGKFESVGIPVRKGGLMGCIVGPDGRGGEALYFNFNQLSGLLFLVQVNPDTGEARQFNAPQGPGAWALIAGPDEKIYLGTWDGALVLRFDPKQPEKGLVVVGKPSPTEDYLWQYDLGKDGKLYACTYPQAKLVSFDPKTDAMEDLGRMHPTEMYARSLAVGPSGKVYVAIGYEKGDLVAFDPATGKHRSILPDKLRAPSGATGVSVWRGADGQAYAQIGGKQARLDDEEVVLVEKAPGKSPMKLRDGREVVEFGRGTFSLKDPQSAKVTARTFKYAGAGDHIFVVGVGPSNCVYGSTAMPLEVFRYDPGANRSEPLGAMPGGEVYSMLEDRHKLYLCYYGGSVMNLYDPAKAILEVRDRRRLQPDFLRRRGRWPPASARNDSWPGRPDLHRQRTALWRTRRRAGCLGSTKKQDHRELPEHRDEPKHRVARLGTQERSYLRRQRQLRWRRHAPEREGSEVFCV